METNTHSTGLASCASNMSNGHCRYQVTMGARGLVKAPHVPMKRVATESTPTVSPSVAAPLPAMRSDGEDENSPVPSPAIKKIRVDNVSRGKPVPYPHDRPIEPVLVELAVRKALSHVDTAVRGQVVDEINSTLRLYCPKIIESEGHTGAHSRLTNWVGTWRPSHPLLMKCIIEALCVGDLLPNAAVVASRGDRSDDRFKLQLTPALTAMFAEHGLALASAGAIAPDDEKKNWASTRSNGMHILQFVNVYARAMAWKWHIFAWTELQSSNDHFSTDARGGGLLFNTKSRRFVGFGLAEALRRCNDALKSK